MMNLKEFLNQFDENLFDEIEQIKAFPFLGDDNETLNQLLILTGGERTVRSSISTLMLPTVARVLVMDYAELWTDLGNLGIKLDGSLADELRIMTENASGSTEQSNSINNTNKVSAFDTDELVIDDGSTTDGTQASTNQNDKNVTEEKYFFGKIFENLNQSQKLKIHRKIITDIVNTLTLSIY